MQWGAGGLTLLRSVVAWIAGESTLRISRAPEQVGTPCRPSLNTRN